MATEKLKSYVIPVGTEFKIPIFTELNFDEIHLESRSAFTLAYRIFRSLGETSYYLNHSSAFGGGSHLLHFDNNGKITTDDTINVIDFVRREHLFGIIGGDKEKVIVKYLGDKQMHDPDYRPSRRF